MMKMFLRVQFLYGIKYGFWHHVLAYAIKYIDDDDDDDGDDDDDDDGKYHITYGIVQGVQSKNSQYIYVKQTSVTQPCNNSKMLQLIEGTPLVVY